MRLKKGQKFGMVARDDGRVMILSSVPITLKFSNRMAYLLGFTDDGYEKAGRSVVLAQTDNVYIFKNKMDLQRDVVRIIKVKSNIIVPSVLNNRYEQILKVFHVPHKTEDEKYLSADFEQLEYHPIIPSTLFKIPIELTTHEDLPVYFSSSVYESLIMSFKIKYFPN